MCSFLQQYCKFIKDSAKEKPGRIAKNANHICISDKINMSQKLTTY